MHRRKQAGFWHKCVGAQVVLIVASACSPNGAPSSGTTELRIGEHRLEVEIAAKPEAHAQGLMHRTSLDEGRGMLFVFPEPRPLCMWMKNTHVALTVAFIDATGGIVNMADMAPATETRHCSTKPVRYALEVSKGWFARRNIQPGAQLGLEGLIP